jgi:hypothetical protein
MTAQGDEESYGGQAQAQKFAAGKAEIKQLQEA